MTTSSTHLATPVLDSQTVRVAKGALEYCLFLGDPKVVNKDIIVAAWTAIRIYEQEVGTQVTTDMSNQSSNQSSTQTKEETKDVK